MLDGDWSAFGGQFSEWSQFRHIVPRDAMSLAPSWRRYCGIDFGFAAPFCALWGAIDNDGRWWIYRESYEKGLAPEEQAKRIMKAEAKDGWVAHFIDPSTVAKPTGGLSVFEMYALAGLSAVALAVNDRIPGWQQVHKALADGPLCLYHAHLAEKGEWSGNSCPRLHVLDGAAPNLCRTLPDAPYDPIRVEDLDTKCEDHAVDSLRYLIASTGLTGQVTVPDDPGPRRLTVEEMGGPTPLPLIAGRFAGNMRQGLEYTGVDFSRTDGSTPGANTEKPFRPVKIPAGGILLSPRTCAAIGPGLQDLLASWHVNGLQAPQDVRTEVEEVAECGRKFQAAQLAKRESDVRPDVRCVDSARSPVVPLLSMTYGTVEVAKKLHIGPRAAQRRAERGSLRATRGPRGELRFDKAEIDRLAKGKSA